jgi:hypothetical protein
MVMTPHVVEIPVVLLENRKEASREKFPDFAWPEHKNVCRYSAIGFQ